jgi:LysR family hydrogen peroxide-inducible transcriptional activator
VDVAILALPVDRPGLTVTPLFEDRFFVAVSAKEARGHPGRYAAGDIAADRLLLLEEGHCLREQALSYCHLASTRNLATLGATSLNTLLEMVAANYGMTLLPEIATRSAAPDPRIVLKRFAPPEPSRTVAMAWRASTARTRDFTELAKLIRAVVRDRNTRG